MKNCSSWYQHVFHETLKYGWDTQTIDYKFIQWLCIFWINHWKSMKDYQSGIVCYESEHPNYNNKKKMYAIN